MIKFVELSIWLKIPIVFSWIIMVLYVLAFMVGFIIGVVE
jgi:hypothetical protein